MSDINVKKTTRIITRTAILLALTIVFQQLGRIFPLGPNSQFIVGPLVNASLIISTAAVGILGGSFIALATPYGAILTGATIPLPFSPFIALGNFVFILFFFILKKRIELGIVTGAIVKFLFLAGSVNFYVWLVNAPAKQASNMLATFTWPQLLTALIGGVLAYIVIKALGKRIELK